MSNYWQERTERRVNQFFTNAEELNKKLKQQYGRALNQISKEISNFYTKYAKNNKMTYDEAIQYLNRKEFNEWKMTLDEYIKEIELTGNQELLKELNALSTRSRIKRLEGLMTSIKVEIAKLNDYEQTNVYDLLAGVCEENYYRTIFDVQQGLGYYTSFAKISPRTIEEVLKTPWSGADFSTRIWNNKEKLINVLQEEITQKMIQGKSIQDTARAIAQRMEVAYKNAERLVRTETAYVVEQSTKLGYKASGVKQYQILATLDTRTSEICREQDGKIYNVDDAVVGVNYPPFHVNCRTTTIPYFDDEGGDRIAKDSSGKYISVPANMTYKTWLDRYVTKETEKSYSELIDLVATNGIKIKAISSHTIERAIQRKIKAEEVREALINPLKIGKIKENTNGKSQEYIGETARVVINPATGNIITVWKTSSKLRNKLKEGVK